jgi:hypothetical protein
MQYLKIYQNKIKIMHLLPNFFFFLRKEKHKNKNMLYGKEPESKPSMCGKIKPVLGERGSELPRQKSSRPKCFFVIPIKYL